jgi:hypothetical protein
MQKFKKQMINLKGDFTFLHDDTIFKTWGLVMEDIFDFISFP